MTFKLNNNIKSISLFERYLLSRQSGIANHKIILSSNELEKNTPKNNSAYRQTGLKPFTYEFEVPGTGITLKKELYPLMDIENQDLLTWVSDIRTAVEQTKWPESVTVALIKNIVGKEIHAKISSLSSFEKVLETILKLRYPERQAGHYLNKAKKIRQKDFYYIHEYARAQENLLNEYFICSNINETGQRLKYQEIFFENLDTLTKLYLYEKDITTKSEALSKIEAMETFILQLSEELNSSNTNQENETKSSFQISKLQNTNNQKNIGIKDKKWCPYHQSATHDKANCFTLQKLKKEKNAKNSKNTNYMLKETGSSINMLKVPFESNEITGTCIIDCGATNNFMSKGMMDKLKSSINENSTVTTVSLADGRSLSIIGETVVEFNLGNIKQVTYKETFKIINNLDEDIILGMEFLNRQKVVLDFKQMVIKIEDYLIKLENDTFYDAQVAPEHSEIDKLKLFNIKENSEIKDIKEELKGYENQNPKLGLIPNTEFTIQLKNDVPIKSTPYAIPFKYYEKIKEEIKRLTKLGVIRKSFSPYGAPAFAVDKRNGDIRLVIDYRKLNKELTDTAYPFPNLWDQLQSIPQCRYFSQLDITMGYHNVKIKNNDVSKTAFVLPWGQYEFLRIPFGIKTAPRCFQEIISKILSDMSFVRVFLDDILIFSQSITEHKTHLIMVLDKLKENNISINFSKSNFLQNEVKYLGYILGTDGIRPNLEKVVKFKEKIPNIGKITKKKIKSIIGFVEWFRPFIPRLSDKIYQFTQKTKKEADANWTQQDLNKLQEILEEISLEPVLTIPDTTKPFVLEVDASDYAIGGILMQNKKIIGMYSKTLLNAEKNYSIMEKEMLGVLKALKHFHKIVYGSSIKVFTDHAKLLHENEDLTKRITKWKVLLLDYDYTLDYQKGDKNIPADFLSRILAVKGNTESPFTLLKISQNYSKEEKEVGDKRKVDGIDIFCDKKDRVLIPNVLEKEVLEYAHSKLNHASCRGIYLALKNYVNIKNLEEKAKEYLKNCVKCQEYNQHSTKLGTYQMMETPKVPFYTVSTDIYGPIKGHNYVSKAEYEKIYLLTMTDHYSRWTEVYILTNINTQSIIGKLSYWISKHGCPTKLISDNGTQYKSTEFEHFLNEKGIKHHVTTTFNPEANGVSERVNCTIKRILNCNQGMNLIGVVQKINYALKHAINRMTGFSPYEIIMGKSIFDPLQRNLDINPEEISETSDRNKAKSLEYANMNRKFIAYKVGDKVYKKYELKGKNQPLWCGPFTVKRICNESVLEIEDDQKTIKVNHRKIRPM